MQIIRLTDRNRLMAGIAAAALVAGVGGVLIGRSMSDQPVAAAPAEEGEAEEEHGPEGFIPMTAERLTASGLAVERVEPGSLLSEIIAQATVAAPPEGQALLTARADGAVVRINKRLGDPVGAGETVALLESREAAQFVAERDCRRREGTSGARGVAARRAAVPPTGDRA